MRNSALPIHPIKPQPQPNLLPVVRRVIEQLDHPDKRIEFVALADRVLLNLQSGYVS